MLYVQRDDQGQLLRVEAAEFEGMNGTLVADDQEALAWYSNQSVENGLMQLKQSDLEMIRVIDDLITLLMAKGIIRITDLPAAAQAKLLNRTQAREALGGLNRLINIEERGVI